MSSSLSMPSLEPPSKRKRENDVDSGGNPNNNDDGSNDENENNNNNNDDDDDDKDALIARLREEIQNLREDQETFYSSRDSAMECKEIPEFGLPASHVRERIVQNHELDNRPRLNTSSYVNVVSEPEERQVAMLGMEVNLADGSVYPASLQLHDQVVNMIAKLWHCPEPTTNNKNYSGAGTVGSTEACLLAALAHKFRWRSWYMKKHSLTQEQIMGVVPNIILSTCYQACWEKLFRYFDVMPRFLVPKLGNGHAMRMDPSQIKNLVDDRTMAVVGILGNHYNGAYDPIWDMDKVVTEINQEKGLQIGIHVDAASGGFIAPFQDNVPPFDFRLPSVLSISASGHKFGESICGTGWLVFRHREDLADHIAVRVTYLGGVSDSITLNFSRPASGPYVQMYKFLRLGKFGYRRKVQRQLDVTHQFRKFAMAMQWGGVPVFQACDTPEDQPSLPVFAARLNPDLMGRADWDEFKLQHAIGEFHWYVGAYHLSFEDFNKGGKISPLVSDEDTNASMFRVVFKSNLTHDLARDLAKRMEQVLHHFRHDNIRSSIRLVLMKVHADAAAKHPHANVHTSC